jgi:hypothetical protein
MARKTKAYKYHVRDVESPKRIAAIRSDEAAGVITPEKAKRKILRRKNGGRS